MSSEKYNHEKDLVGVQHVENPDDPSLNQEAVDDHTAHIKASIAKAIASNVDDYETLIQEARLASERDSRMPIRQAFKTYPKAIGWAMLLSTSLVMEGYDTALLSPFYAFPPFLEKFGQIDQQGQRYISATWQNGLSNGGAVGGIIGLQAAGYLAERFGYRKTIIGSLVFMTGFIFIPFFCQSLTQLLIGEILQGLAWGTFQTITTAYGAEVCPVPMRHFLTSYTNICWVMGQLIASGVLKGFLNWTNEWGYRIPFAIQWIWPIPIAIGCYLAPESPWWLTRKGRHEQARRSLRRLARKDGCTDQDIDRQLALMVHTNEMEKFSTAGTSYLDCFRGVNLRRTEIVCVTWISQNWCGASLMGLSAYFYTQAGMSTSNAFTFSIGQYALGMVGTIISWFVMLRVGRRPMYFWGSIALATLLLIIGCMGIPKNASPALSWTAGTMMLLYVGVFDLTLGPVCYTLCAEIPSSRLRPKQIVLARNFYNVSGLISNVLTPRMLNQTAWNWGAKAGFFWSANCYLCSLWIFFRLPETKGRTFGELDILFENKVPARKFASTDVDQFGPVDGHAASNKAAEFVPVAMH